MSGKIRVIMLLLLAMTVSHVLFGGGGKEIKSPNTGESAVKEDSKPVNLKFWVYPKWNGVTGKEPDGKGGDWEHHVADEFMKLHPNVKIEIEVLDFASGPEKVAIALASGKVANVLHDSEPRMFEYANKGFLVPFDDQLSSNEKEEYVEGALAMASLTDGKPYYLPFGTSPILMMVNRSLFEKAGTTHLLPKNNDRTWTIDQYYNAVKATVQKLNNVYAVPLFGNTTTGDAFTFVWVWAHGGRIVDTTTGTMALNTPQAKAGLSFWRKLIDEKLTPPGGAGMRAGDVWTLFDQQLVLTVPAATVNYARAKAAQATGKVKAFNIDLYFMPMAPGVRQISSGFPHGFAVFKNKDAVVQKWSVIFAKFLASDRFAGAVKAANEFSFKKSQADMYIDSPDANMRFASKAMNYQIPNGTSIVGYTRLRNEINPYMQMLYLGQISVDEFVSKVETLGNDLPKRQ